MPDDRAGKPFSARTDPQFARDAAHELERHSSIPKKKKIKVRVKNGWALVARRINADWQQKYGHGLDWLESFVELGRFRGTCYTRDAAFAATFFFEKLLTNPQRVTTPSFTDSLVR